MKKKLSNLSHALDESRTWRKQFLVFLRIDKNTLGVGLARELHSTKPDNITHSVRIVTTITTTTSRQTNQTFGYKTKEKMVIASAAAIGAASYGLFKGGEASVRKGEECKREYQREKKRQSQRNNLRDKVNSRSSKIAQLVQMKQDQSVVGQAEAETTVNDRHQAVMAKLKSGREEKKKGFSSLFKKK